MDKVKRQLKVFDRITFEEDTHRYLIDGEYSNSPSVTRLLHQFKKPFELETIARCVARREGVPVDVIKQEWALNNLYSTTIGSMLHKYIEGTYIDEHLEFKLPFGALGVEEKEKIKKNFPVLVKQFKEYFKDSKHLKCLKSEIIVGDVDDTRICGTSDMLALNKKTGELEIIDFKTNKKMESKGKYGNLLYPFDDMPACELAEYTIQLNTYKYVVEKMTDLKIGQLKLVWFNVNNPSYKEFKLDHIQKQIEEMFDRFKAKSLFEAT